MPCQVLHISREVHLEDDSLIPYVTPPQNLKKDKARFSMRHTLVDSAAAKNFSNLFKKDRNEIRIFILDA